ncbi:MAG: sulfotransferase [Planctomycetota bacterium]|nr:sulfotransferase [Planctomycetota bacterium]
MSSVFVTGLSRSGTTLLATILDSHPDVSMGYELLPGSLGSLSQLAAAIDTAIEDGAQSAREVAKALPSSFSPECGVFIKRSARTLVTPELLAPLLHEFSRLHGDNPTSLRERAHIADVIVEAKRNIEATRITGFKIPLELSGHYVANDSNNHVIAVIRDPRDVAASQVSRGMASSMGTFARSWSGYASEVRSLEKRGVISLILRYEDLVTQPDSTISNLQETLGLSPASEMRSFFKSKASVHAPGQRHVNAEALSQDVFDSSIGRWKTDFSDDDVKAIEQICFKGMVDFNYEPAHVSSASWLPTLHLTHRLRSMVRRLR